MRFAAILEKTCDTSGASGFVYGLLSWEIFRREEERLYREEHLSAIAASKAVNKHMVEKLDRRAKTRDWASDGRKAAKMVFDVLRDRNMAEQSFAILLLGSGVSLDGMLKIAHFPATRERFSTAFAQIVQGFAGHWNFFAKSGYKIFDHDRFLTCRSVFHDPQEIAKSSKPLPFLRALSPATQSQIPFGMASTASAAAFANNALTAEIGHM
ncbi:MAG: hypothetical protein Q9214_005940 [Letrouitia sp. 1 TL-2023]